MYTRLLWIAATTPLTAVAWPIAVADLGPGATGRTLTLLWPVSDRATGLIEKGDTQMKISHYAPWGSMKQKNGTGPVGDRPGHRFETKLLVGLSTVAVLLALLWSAGLVIAGQPFQHPAGDVAITGDVSSKISYQGVLRENGQPVSGSRNMVFRLYSNPACSTQVGGNIIKSGVPVTGGRFAVDLDVNHRDFNGQALWLEVEVAGTRIGCEAILPVPYALSLRPGAHIAGSVTASPYAALHVWNTATSGSAYGIKGGTDSPSGRAIYGDALHGGTGVYAKSDTGIAIRAAGTGIVQSTANSYLWISGNGARPFHQADSTVIDLDSKGGAIIRRGPDAGRKNVMLPITVVGPLYGQDVTVTDLDIFWKGRTEFDAITAVILRRQTGVGAYANIIFDVGGAGYACEESLNPNGCTIHYDTTSNNVLTADSGILYLTLELSFNSDSSWMQVGGARLTLKHE